MEIAPVLPVDSLTPGQKVELFEAMLLQQEQADVKIEHQFLPGVYVRKGTIAAGVVLVGHLHKHDHLNILFSGRVSVSMNGEVSEFVGPCVFAAKAGVRKVIYAHEDSVMANVHQTDLTDLDQIEDAMIVKSETFLLNQQGLNSDLMALAKVMLAPPAALEN